MREIKHIVIHCTATSKYTKVESIKRYWSKVLGWKSPGYHRIIDRFGEVFRLASYEQPTNGVQGYNRNAIHISYIGGIDEKGNPKDTRTPEQHQTMHLLVKFLKEQYPKAKILGHRDFPGVKKACPSFDVAEWLKEVGIPNN